MVLSDREKVQYLLRPLDGCLHKLHSLFDGLISRPVSLVGIRNQAVQALTGTPRHQVLGVENKLDWLGAWRTTLITPPASSKTHADVM